MNTIFKACLLAATGSIALSSMTYAQDTHEHHHDHSNAQTPISIMGDHTHKKGEWMTSYRYRRMQMQGSRQGTNSISPEDIVTTVANPNGPPSTLRVVPTEMTMEMHMLGAMYGVTDRFTVMAMAMYVKKTMDHVTFQGGAGTNRLGEFTTRSSGFGDTSVRGIYNLYETPTSQVNVTLGISAPTGSIKEEDTVLSPMNTRPRLRLPYAMQLGSGTWDALPGITYTGHKKKWGWGAQYNATIRLESENSQGYRFGHRHSVSGWGSYKINKEFSINSLISAETTGEIKGSDDQITAPVQTADPENYGGDIVTFGAGFLYSPKHSALENLEFGADIAVPVYQDLNGVQLERDWTLSAAIRYRF